LVAESMLRVLLFKIHHPASLAANLYAPP